MKFCVGNSKHSFKPLSDSYQKYKELPPDDLKSSGSYRQREEITPGLMYATLFCVGCGTVIEVISENTTGRKMHNDTAKKETQNTTAKGNGAPTPEPSVTDLSPSTSIS